MRTLAKSMPDLHGNKPRRTGSEVICVKLNTLNSLLTGAKNVGQHRIRRAEMEENKQKVKSQDSEDSKQQPEDHHISEI